MNPAPPVAFFTDSFHEVNGVAHTSRHFDAFARRRGLPFLNVHAGPKTCLTEDGPVWTLELKRSRLGFSLEHDMSFDLAFLRYRDMVTRNLKKFGADIVHITGPSDVGMPRRTARRIGSGFRWLQMSWHTNIHGVRGVRRLAKTLDFDAMSQAVAGSIVSFVENRVIPRAERALLRAGACSARAQSRAGRTFAPGDRQARIPDAARRRYRPVLT